jgi:hypothetical protein
MVEPNGNDEGLKKESGQPIEQQPQAQGAHVPPPENNPASQNAAQVGEESDGKRIENLEGRMRTAEKLVIWLTGAIAVFALCSVIVGLLQWCVMSGELQQIKYQSYGGSKAIRMQRPLFTGRVRLQDEPRNQNNFRAVVELENVGSTPGIDLVESTQIWIADSEKSGSVTWNDCPKIGVLMKSEHVSCETAPLSATPDEVQTYQRRASRLYVRVYAIYWDDIEGDFRHQQSMCLFHTFGEPLDHFNYCASGNDIWHDNCEKRVTENPPHPPDAASQGPKQPSVCSGTDRN